MKTTVMATGAASITLQLNSSTATATSEGSYRLDLEPPISVPYLAAPRAALTDMAFVNTGLNVSEKFSNNKVTIQLSYISSDTHGGQHQTVASLSRNKEYSITIPDGHYSVDSLETEIARQMYKSAGTNIGEIKRITPTTTLWQDMNMLVKRQPHATTLNGNFLKEANQYNEFSVTLITLGAVDGTGTIAALPPHYIGSEIKFIPTIDNGTPILGGIVTNISDNGKAITFSTPVQFDGGAYDISVEFTPTSTVIGYGVGDVAEPSLDPGSYWSEVLQIEELKLIADTHGVAANSIIPDAHRDDSAKTVIHQSNRYVKPLYLKPDPLSNMMRAVTAYPKFTIKDTSTLFTKVLGFSAANPSDFTSQDPFTNNGKLWTASKEGTLVRVKTVVFHCPTLIESSYAPSGKREGAQMQVVPVTAAPGGVQVWQSMYDNSIPCALHGGDIGSIEFYIRDQDQNFIELQSTAFQATLRLTWDDPAPPRLGSAGADAEYAYGLRDVTYGYR
eukprot:COSAG02_NODE_665_length_18739_cov_9.192918_7_plen_503_part_00